ncbi:MAG TPA: hypothetical protein VKB73_05820 [Gaiellaceae bacterium]|nr:hypothetical protein [Gaiellaceae bacterium]
MSHFDAVGFAVGEEAEADELVSNAFDRAVEGGDFVDHTDGRTARYRDPSGALLTIHTDGRGRFECCQPGFEGDFRTSWRPVGVVRDPDCRFCDLVYAELLDDGEMTYPFGLTVETIGAERALIPYGEASEVTFSGLWEEGEVWPDEEAFRREEESEWADVEVPEAVRDEIPAFRGWASRSLIPSGTFPFAEGGTMTPHVLAHGIVSSVEERRNELGGAPFRLVRFDTLGGVFDTCLAPGAADREELLGPGAVARATLWLVGRPVTLRAEPGPVPSVKKPGGLFGRFLRQR